MDSYVQPPGEQDRKDGKVYFFGETSSESWAATLDDTMTVGEAEIHDFIRFGNPDLFRRLNGLPFASTEIPLSYHGQQSLRKAQEMEREIVPPFKSYETSSQPPSAQHSPLCVSTTDSSHQQYSQNKELKHHVQSLLLNGHFLILRGLPYGSIPPPCTYPDCPQGRKVAPQGFFLAMKYNFYTPSCSPTNKPEFYCLSCMEDIFRQYQKAATESSYVRSQTILLDGVSRDEILSAASRLFPVLQLSDHDNNISTSSGFDFPFNHPSNSSHAFKLRKMKEMEINATLDEVAKYEKAIISAKKDESLDSPSPSSLLITRPVYMEPAKERYRKQGLTPYDYEKARKASNQSAASNSISCKTTMEELAVIRYCHCREPEDDTEMIRCSSGWCAIGWFHLRCLELKRLPTTDEAFLCSICSDDQEVYEQFNHLSQASMNPNGFIQNKGNGNESDESFNTTSSHFSSGGDLDPDYSESAETPDAEELSNGVHANGQSKDLPIWSATLNRTPSIHQAQSRRSSQSDKKFDTEMGTDNENTTNLATSDQEFNRRSEIFDSEDNESTTSLAAYGSTSIRMSEVPDSEDEDEELIENILLRCKGQRNQVDGINSSDSTYQGPTHSLEFDRPPSRSDISGSINTRFDDLAPFIFAENLLPRQMEVFELWKRTRPLSRLVGTHRIETQGAGNGFQRKLSDLLYEVD